eukprot:5838426-Amphidinium_carterae.1
MAAQACTTASHTAKSNKGKGKGKPEEESGGIPLLELKRWGRNTPAATIKEDAKRFLQRLAEVEPATTSEDVFAPFARCSVCHIRVSSREVGWKMIMATKAEQIPLGEGTAIMSWQAPPEVRRFRGRVSAVCDALKKSLEQLGAPAPQLEPCWKSGQIWPSTVSQNWAAKVCRHTLTVSFNEQGLTELHHQLTPEVVQKSLDAADPPLAGVASPRDICAANWCLCCGHACLNSHHRHSATNGCVSPCKHCASDRGDCGHPVPERSSQS